MNESRIELGLEPGNPRVLTFKGLRHEIVWEATDWNIAPGCTFRGYEFLFRRATGRASGGLYRLEPGKMIDPFLLIGPAVRYDQPISGGGSFIAVDPKGDVQVSERQANPSQDPI